MNGCMQECQKLNGAVGPLFETRDKMDEFGLKLMAYTKYEFGMAPWVSWTDKKVSGEWRNWFTGDLKDIKELLGGGEGKLM